MNAKLNSQNNGEQCESVSKSKLKAVYKLTIVQVGDNGKQ